MIRYFSCLAAVLLMHTRSAAQWSGATIDTLTMDALRDETDIQAIAVDDQDAAHAVWKKELSGGGWRIFYARKSAPGSWGAAREVGDSSIAAFSPALAVTRDAGHPYVAFSAMYPESEEIVVAHDSGGVWVRTRITVNTSWDLAPTIAVDASGVVHVAWINEDSSSAWKIFYATNRIGAWETHRLDSSDLGSFGSGASPFIAVTSFGVPHIFYRGGDFGTYRIHHAYDANATGTEWAYESINTPNANDFIAAPFITPDSTIHLLASGNDGFGFPPHAYYMRKPVGAAWSIPELATTSGAGWGGSLVIDAAGSAHISWNEVSGNIYTGNLFYATNTSGSWNSTAILADGQTYNGSLVLDGSGIGYALMYNGTTFEMQEIFALRSTGPLTPVGTGGFARPETWRLFQNYPNPFNPVTRIRFDLPAGQAGIPGPVFVTLRVFNMLGQEVATLVNGESERGSYEVTWDAREFPSGTYFCRLQAEGVIQTRKLLLLK